MRTKRTTRQTSTPRQAGFTLVELLVVIGIIALLIGILLPALNKARGQANFTKCMANQRQLVTGLLMYCGEYKGMFPGYTKMTPDGTQVVKQLVDWDTVVNNPYSLNKDVNEGSTWLLRYVVGSELAPLMFCPSDDTQKFFKSPSPGKLEYRTSYRYPLSLLYTPDEICFKSGSLGDLQMHPQKISQVKNTTKKALITDALTFHSRGKFGRPNDLSSSDKFFVDIAIGFADGHVERINTKEMFDTDINYTGRNTTPQTAGVKGRDVK